MSINKVFLVGNLTREPELKATQNGNPILRMGLAVNDRIKNPQTQEWEDKPNYIDLVMFGTRAERVAQYLTKGKKVSVSGKLSFSSWQDKQTGQNRSKLEVVVDDIEFMAQKQEGGVQYMSPAPVQAPVAPVQQVQPIPAQTAPVPAPTPGEVYDENIPF